VVPLLIYGNNPTIGQQVLFYIPLMLLLIAGSFGLAAINRHFQKEQEADLTDLSVEPEQEEIQAIEA
jgi:hypothetical protein